ncbi:MAG: hypothetical protein ABSH26_18140 [Opitutaceae bacterium]|jgi:hypothetical protein
MLFKNLTFEFDDNPRNFFPLMGPAVLVLRVTADTLEFKHYQTSGAESVIVLRGRKLWLLLPTILDNQLRDFRVEKPFASLEAEITGIRHEDIFTPLVKGTLGPERNPVKTFQFCVDTGRDRYFFPHESLEAWGCGKQRFDERIFVQFKARHSFILHPVKGDFLRLLAVMKHDNFNLGSVNKISPYSDYYYQFGGHNVRYEVASVEARRSDVGISGDFTILMDNRIKAPTVQHAQPVGMDMS